MTDTVRVTCSVPNGLELRLFEESVDPMDIKTFVVTGETTKLAGPAPDGTPGSTEVDKAFFDKWLEQNAENPVVAGKLVGLEKREEDRR